MRRRVTTSLRRHGLSVTLPFLSWLTLACAREPKKRTAELRLHPCVSLATRELARCGTMLVPERRDRPDGRMLELRVMILPARGARVDPDPLVFFNGGPGLSTTAYAGYASWALDTLRHTRDLLLVDMRGTGNNAPLACDLYRDGNRLAPYLEPMFPLARVRECAAALSRRADLTQYTTEAAAQDFDDVRAALRIERVNLYGASYGSRLALTYMRLFPSHVRRAVLLGVSPPGAPVGRVFARATQQVLDSAFVSCAASSSCRRDVPDPRNDIAALLARLRAKPAEVRLWNARRLSTETVTLTAHAIAELLWVESYSPDALRRVLPLVHQAVATSDYTALAQRLAAESRARRAGRREGLMLSVICAEDAPRLSPGDASDAQTLLGAPVVMDLLAACSVWPRGSVTPDFAKPFVSSIPTLLISGGRDPVTPHELADSTATRLSRSERYLDPTKGHAALDDQSRTAISVFIQALKPEAKPEGG
jgi:pimeloyl-ACP methyl ester carboxylesterase